MTGERLEDVPVVDLSMLTLEQMKKINLAALLQQTGSQEVMIATRDFVFSLTLKDGLNKKRRCRESGSR